MLEAYHGMPREALVEPSTGSTTATSADAGPVHAALLGDHPDARLVEHLEDGPVGDQVDGVLPRPLASRAASPRPGPGPRARRRRPGGTAPGAASSSTSADHTGSRGRPDGAPRPNR